MEARVQKIKSPLIFCKIERSYERSGKFFCFFIGCIADQTAIKHLGIRFTITHSGALSAFNVSFMLYCSIQCCSPVILFPIRHVELVSRLDISHTNDS